MSQELAIWLRRKRSLLRAPRPRPARLNRLVFRLRRELPWQQLPEGRLQEASADVPADEALYAKQRQRRVGAVLAELPDEQRAVVTLSFVDGLSHSAIAETTKLPLGTVKSRLRLAFGRLRQALEDPADA